VRPIMAETAFTMFAVDSPRTLMTLKKRLTERRLDLSDQLRTAMDWPQHKYTCGCLDEVDGLLLMLAEIEQER
jgi:hypothetical protein